MNNIELYPHLLQYIINSKIDLAPLFDKYTNGFSIEDLRIFILETNFEVDPNSPFGYFIRKSSLELKKLSFEEVSELKMISECQQPRPTKIITDEIKLRQLYEEFKLESKSKSLLNYTKAYENLLKFTNMYISMTDQSYLPFISIMFSTFHAMFDQKDQCKVFAEEALEGGLLLKNPLAISFSKEIISKLESEKLDEIDFDGIFDKIAFNK